MGTQNRASASRRGKIPQEQQHAGGPVRARSYGRSALRIRLTEGARTAPADNRTGAGISGDGPMMKLALSAAAAGLLRSLLARAGIDRDRILLTEFRSVDWQSLTFIGERHEMELRIPAPGAIELAGRITEGLEEAEFAIPGQIVADIRLDRPFQHNPDGSISLFLEALTIAE